MQIPQIRKESYLRLFWFLLAFSLIVGTVALFETRNADRDLAISKQGQKIYTETIEAHPDTKEAIQALMQCIQKKYLKVDKTTDEEDINRPRQVCPRYAEALEATHPSPMGMKELELAYRQLIIGLKDRL